MDKGKVGDVVWYVVGPDTARQQAKIIDTSGTTHATIKLLTGPQKGQEFEAPWGIIEPYSNLKPAYQVTAENKVIGPEGTLYDEGVKGDAERLAAFLNSKDEFEQALEDVLDKHDYPLSGTEWRDMLRRIAIKGEQG